MKIINSLLSVLLLLVVVQGQKTATPLAGSQSSPKTEAPADIGTAGEIIQLPPDRRYQVRELQYQIDQNEIKIQKLQVQIEQLKQQQIQGINDISVIATDFARVAKVDLNAYELDAVNLRLVKKKSPALVAMPVAQAAPAMPDRKDLPKLGAAATEIKPAPPQ
jgi:TolA-binding protein